MSQQGEQPDDGRLVERTLRGDRAAFERLYDRHARRVRAVVSCAAEDSTAVDDLVQECFLRAYRKLDQLRPQEHFGPWLVGIGNRNRSSPPFAAATEVTVTQPPVVPRCGWAANTCGLRRMEIRKVRR
jgi:hypothetical protein